MMFSTGCKSLDAILDGGIRFNTILNIYGESATGKTQFCFQLSLNVTSKLNSHVYFIDALNNFRPERIIEMAYHNNIQDDVLSKIYVVRPLSINDALNAINKIDEKTKLIIIDDVSELVINTNPKDIEKMLVLFMRSLSLKAIKYDLAIILTNRITFTGSQTTQKFNDIISRFVHFKIVFKKVNGLLAQLLQPYESSTRFRISRKGLEDYL